MAVLLGFALGGCFSAGRGVQRAQPALPTLLVERHGNITARITKEVGPDQCWNLEIERPNFTGSSGTCANDGVNVVDHYEQRIDDEGLLVVGGRVAPEVTKVEVTIGDVTQAAKVGSGFFLVMIPRIGPFTIEAFDGDKSLRKIEGTPQQEEPPPPQFVPRDPGEAPPP